MNIFWFTYSSNRLIFFMSSKTYSISRDLNLPYFVCLILLITMFLPPKRSIAQKVSTDALRAHTGFLADDLLEGRGTASRGEALAALYIISNLRAYGLKPIPGTATSDFRIPVPLTSYRFDTSETQLKIQSADSNFILSPPDFYHPGGAPSSFQNFGGTLLFAGATPKALSKLKEYSDLTGYVVVLGPPWNGIAEVESELLHRGAEGAIEVVPNAFYDRLRMVRGPTRYALPPEVDDPQNQSRLPTVIIGPSAAQAIGILKKVRSKKEIELAQNLQINADIDFGISAAKKTGYNVAALIPGSSTAKADSIVTFMAHYDHVGFGQPTKQDSIWNGFTDNASGTAMLLEIARVLAADPPAYSVLFLFTTAEEQGLLGATWFVHQPPFSLDKIKTVINLDGGIPPPDVRQWTVAASKEFTLAPETQKILQSNRWQIKTKPIISDSDHWPFHRAGIPALFLYPGSQISTKYIHTAQDEWQPDFPFQGLAHYTKVALIISEVWDH